MTKKAEANPSISKFKLKYNLCKIKKHKMPMIMEVKPKDNKIEIPETRDIEKIVLIIFKKSERKPNIYKLLGKYKPRKQVDVHKIVKESIDELYDRYTFHR